MKKTILASTMAALTLVGAGALASDPQRSRSQLEYSDVVMERPDFDEPFQRDGRVLPVEKILQVVAGATAEQVREALGNPIQTGQGVRGPEWDYNLKLDLADEDFIVCQYKVVFDGRSEQVVETQWRRYQCRDALAAEAANPRS